MQGGTARTVLIVCCSPCAENGPESLSSLRFGARARGIKNRCIQNERLSTERLLQQLGEARQQLAEAQGELAQLKGSPAAIKAAGGTGGRGVGGSGGGMPGSNSSSVDISCEDAGATSSGGLGKLHQWVPWLLHVASIASVLVYMAWEDWYYRSNSA